MTQAARSITANMAEGCSRHQTSRETEMRLLDVARASASELHGDIFFLMLRIGIEPWTKDDMNHQNFNNIRLDRPDYSVDWEQKAWRNIQAQYGKFKPWNEHENLNIALNSMLLLCNREIVLIERLINKQLEDFKKDGGFTENLSFDRIEFKKQQAQVKGSPSCPKCGATMVERIIKKGIHSGQKFWGCINYPKCDGARDM